MILVAGPYRGGTNDDPVLIQRNVLRVRSMSGSGEPRSQQTKVQTS